jgi:site-specific DNA-cytosine methylase
MLQQIVGLLQRSGYSVDLDTHKCGEIGELAQIRVRFFLVARHLERCPDFWRKPPRKRVKNVGEVLLTLPSPVADHGDPMHRLPLLSPLNWLRLAAIRAGRDWRDLPPAIRLGGKARRSGAYEVLDSDDPAKVVRGRHDVWAAPASVADPRVGWDPERHKGRPDSFGVERIDEPAHTIRGRQEVQTSRRSVADPRLGERSGRQNGGFGVESADAPAHAVLAEGTVRNTRASVADPRLGCTQRAGSYGVQDPAEPAGAVLGHHSHDNAVGSFADPRLSHDPGAERGTWHRPMTLRELFKLQGGEDSFVVEGPRSSSKTQPGVGEWIGNMIPVGAAEAIGRSAYACVTSTASAGFLRGQDVWVSPEREEAPSRAPLEDNAGISAT